MLLYDELYCKIKFLSAHRMIHLKIDDELIVDILYEKLGTHQPYPTYFLAIKLFDCFSNIPCVS